MTRSDTKRFAVTPTISPNLLATCRQIYNEASKLLYLDNEITVIIDVHDTFAPVINEARLPQRALENLQHVCLIVDATANFQASYEDVDFTPLSALVSLESLRLCMVYSSRPQDSTEQLAMMLIDLTKEILTRVPSTTKLYWELEPGSHQQDLANYVLAKGRQRHGNSSAARSFTAITGSAGGSFVRRISIVPPEMLRDAVASVDQIRGSKSGTASDVFAEHRAELKGFAWRS